MTIQKFILILLIILTTFQCSFGQQKIEDDKCRVPFELKYEKVGILYVLLEPQYFKQQKLKSLFLCLSQKRSNLAFLQIVALSDEKQLNQAIESFTKDLTTNRILIGTLSLMREKGWKPTPPPPPNFYRAYYNRYQTEYFEYSPNPQEWETVTVILKKALKK
jgi:hypothetical protein